MVNQDNNDKIMMTKLVLLITELEESQSNNIGNDVQRFCVCFTQT